jgi:hypothetical protein
MDSFEQSQLCLEWDRLHNRTAREFIDELFVENDCGNFLMAECGWNQLYPRTVEDALSGKELRNRSRKTDSFLAFNTKKGTGIMNPYRLWPFHEHSQDVLLRFCSMQVVIREGKRSHQILPSSMYYLDSKLRSKSAVSTGSWRMPTSIRKSRDKLSSDA